MSAPRRRRAGSAATRAEPATAAAGPSYADKVRTLLRESLLDAAAQALTEHSWTAVRMADVAAAVGVSRQTVYNEFGSKDELARALLLREATRFLARVEEALDQHPNDPVGGLVAAVEVFLLSAAEEPLLHAIFGGGDHEDLSPLMTNQGLSVLPVITGQLTERFRRDWPDADPVQVNRYADAAVRLAISHVVLPAGDPRDAAADVARVLAPYVLQLTA